MDTTHGVGDGAAGSSPDASAIAPSCEANLKRMRPATTATPAHFVCAGQVDRYGLFVLAMVLAMPGVAGAQPLACRLRVP